MTRLPCTKDRTHRLKIYGLTAILAILLLLFISTGLSTLFFQALQHGPSRIGPAPRKAESSPLQTRTKSHEHEDNKLAAALRTAEDSIRRQRLQAEADGSNRPTLWTLFKPGGDLTREAVSAAGLSDQEAALARDVIHSHWNRAADFFANNLVLDQSSDEENQHYVYRYTAPEDRRNKTMLDFKQDLKDAVGASKQATLLKGLNPYDCLGNFGALNIKIVLLLHEGTFSFEYLSPRTGDPFRTGSFSLWEFEEHFGDTMDLSRFRGTQRPPQTDPDIGP